ncbi:MAG: HAD-IA family hydrolase [Prevotella sp.]|nr:HAD-IA family hydrolase [Prevotella sp.]
METKRERHIRLIIFDFDGTLGDTRQNILTTMRQTMEERGLDIADETACIATIGLPLAACFRELYPALSEQEIDTCADTYRRLFDINKKHLKPALFPHVAETLRHLHGQGLTLTVASSRSSASLREFLDEMGIAEYISYVVGADDVTHAKPDPEPVLKTLAALDIPADKTLVVGDMPVDILMGKGAGTLTCGVTYGNATREEIEEAGADFIIDSMDELTGIIMNIINQ